MTKAALRADARRLMAADDIDGVIEVWNSAPVRAAISGYLERLAEALSVQSRGRPGVVVDLQRLLLGPFALRHVLEVDPDPVPDRTAPAHPVDQHVGRFEVADDRRRAGPSSAPARPATRPWSSSGRSRSAAWSLSLVALFPSAASPPGRAGGRGGAAAPATPVAVSMPVPRVAHLHPTGRAPSTG